MSGVQQSPYRRVDVVRAVHLSALLGWALKCLPVFSTGHFGFVFAAAMVGLPIAFILCWLIAAPILHRVMKRPVGWLRAAVWGAVIAVALRLVYIGWSRWLGWRQSIDDSSYSQIGGGDYVRSVDGILTAYGWQVEAMWSALFIAYGVAVAVMVRAVIGPGAPQPMQGANAL